MLKNLIKKLSSIIPFSQAVLEAELLVEFVSGYKKKDFILYPDLSLNKEQQDKLDYLLKKRLQERIPVQYLIEQACFMGEIFNVNKDVLIPRPETELLVEEVIKVAKNMSSPKILDIGTGSGVIAVMLKKLINCSVAASDISKAALDVAESNARRLGLDVEFVCSDLFEEISEKFNIIVSNPPYISQKEKGNLSDEVLNEPYGALFTNDVYGTEFYEKIILQATSFLEDGGYLFFELGINQSMLVKNLFENNGFSDIKIVKDFSKIDRIISAKYSYNT